MIAIRMAGGLGNLMFQIATGETWRQRGYDVVYTNMDENLEYIGKNYTPKRNSEVYKSLFPNFTWDAHKAPKDAKLNQVHVPFTYTEIDPVEGTEYIGYFQSEKNFPNRELILNLFEPSWEVFQQMAEYDYNWETTCSIHIRRQDYLNLSEYHHNLTMDYYTEAIDFLSPFEIYKFLVFSDDVLWCRDKFRGDLFDIIDANEYVSMYLMSRCALNIIANSSLSFWGAWYGDVPGKTIVCPSQWFGTKGEDSRDIIPERWIKL